MFYTNESLKVVEKEMKFGTLKCVLLGQEGRGRTQVVLPVPNSFNTGDYIKIGLHKDLTLGITKSGKPRINRRVDNEFIYACISTEDGYSRRGNGGIQHMEYDGSKEIVYASGADGDAGGIGIYPTEIIRIPNDGKTRIIRCTPSGKGYRKDSQQNIYYIFTKDRVDAIWNGSLERVNERYDFDTLSLIRPYKDTLFGSYYRLKDTNKVSKLYKMLTELKDHMMSVDEFKSSFSDRIAKQYNQDVYITDPEIEWGRNIRDDAFYVHMDKESISEFEYIISSDYFLDEFCEDDGIYIVKSSLTNIKKLYIDELLFYLKWNLDSGFLK